MTNLEGREGRETAGWNHGAYEDGMRWVVSGRIFMGGCSWGVVHGGLFMGGVSIGEVVQCPTQAGETGGVGSRPAG